MSATHTNEMISKCIQTAIRKLNKYKENSYYEYILNIHESIYIRKNRSIEWKIINTNDHNEIKKFTLNYNLII